MTTAEHDMTDADAQLLAEAATGYRQLKDQIGRVVIGQEEVVRQLLASIFAEGHVLVIGVPGLAKTLLVKTLAGVLGWSFKRIQFTPDMMPADIIGMEMLREEGSAAGLPGGRHWEFMR
ncbi:MAG: AAA family ATPase, partial [Planctomycetota bacterium]